MMSLRPPQAKTQTIGKEKFRWLGNQLTTKNFMATFMLFIGKIQGGQHKTTSHV